ncbi:unnamed protein product [Rotaria socialis]|uniref:Methyltransferase domain-containing protein n=1 Tax=Rotaria socialis TaxID=392032 RepID=A0A819ZMJ2_9BILA|nr:unnamed protein product [Rotaria socialis]CAF3346989.1 unnamed protein product [Rotaria socialis]CAF4098209.1 unnamed protein product [Rotaria socialis]CAF4164920.1 unnamed protein product [Rotaria socialis]
MLDNQSEDKKFVYYIEEPPINSFTETFFANYASIPISELRNHLVSVRERAWQKHNYPCLGRWSFLRHSIQRSSIYKEILEKSKQENAKIIDFGCCLGQDVRQLIYDGVSLDQIRGYDLDPFFIEQGYELFRDDILMNEKKVFGVGDIFDDKFLETIEPADYVHVGSFIHLFDAETQRNVCQRLTRIAKYAITGRQVGASVPAEHQKLSGSIGSKMMRHSPESFASMWNDVTSGEWQVESATLEAIDDVNGFGKILYFVVRKRKEH